MGKNKAFTRRKYILFGGGSMLGFFWLSFHAYSASQFVDGDVTQYLGSNIYLSSDIAESHSLAASIEIESKGLEFMVWDRERQELNLKLSKLLQRRINLTPFNGPLWGQLASLQKQSGESDGDRAWVLQRASTLLRWNFNHRTELSHYCIVGYYEFQTVSADLCSSLLLNLPANFPLERIARVANVKPNDLRAVLALEEAKIEEAKVEKGGVEK